ncbi:thiamine phosphate synthase [Flavitalea flava]
MAQTTDRSGKLNPEPEQQNGIARLQFLTMDVAPLDHLQQIEQACQAGIRWIQLRMKLAGDVQFLEKAILAKKITDAWNATLIINDRVEIAKKIGAHGVHLGKEDMRVGDARSLLGKDFIIGGTANTAEDILDHYRKGADYIGLGPYRFTTSKKKLSPVLGLVGYRRVMDVLRNEAVEIPIVAIGGLHEEDAGPLMQTGLYGIAFSGLLVHAGNRTALVNGLQNFFPKN